MQMTQLMHTSGEYFLYAIKNKRKDDLECVLKWFHENDMFLDSDKAKYVVIGTRQRLRSHQA